MGTSSATPEELAARAAYRASTGTTFAHTSSIRSGRTAASVHESLDPKWTNKAGEQIRECRDSVEHPMTLPVVVLFDETGSMGRSAYVVQEKLAGVKGVTLRAGLTDAQLLFGAYGDADNGEVAPCQIGQFESGTEMEEWLNNIYIEGNGGGNGHETAGLAMWFLANFSALDSVEKRGKKGYMILIGDEVSNTVRRSAIENYIGNTKGIEGDAPMEVVVQQASELYDIYFLLVHTGADVAQGSEGYWSNLLGADHVLPMESLDNLAETISALIAAGEGLTVDAVMNLLREEGADEKALMAVSKSLATWEPKTAGVAKIAETSSTLDIMS